MKFDLSTQAILVVASLALGVGYFAGSRNSEISGDSMKTSRSLKGVEAGNGSEMLEEISALHSRIAQLEEKSDKNAKSDESKTSKSETNSVGKKATSKSRAFVRAVWSPDGSHLDDPFLGNQDSEIVVMGFIDYFSESSKSFLDQTFPLIRSNLVETDKIKFILRDFPLDQSAKSKMMAQIGHCAGEQAQYFEMADYLLNWDSSLYPSALEYAGSLAALDSEKFDSCMGSRRYRSEAEQDYAEGLELGVVGAPAFFLGRRQLDGSLKGYLLRGAQPFQVFESLISRL